MSNQSGKPWKKWTLGSLETELLPPEGKQPSGTTDGDQPSAVEFTARTELQILREEAYAEAYALGLAEGMAKGIAEGREAGLAQGIAEGNASTEKAKQTAVSEIETLAVSIGKEIKNLDRQVIEQLTHLAMTVGRKLGLKELSATPESIGDLILDIIKSEPDIIGNPKLVLNPADRAKVEYLIQSAVEDAGWTIQTDENIQAGGCRIIGPKGEIDATVETRWAHLQGIQKEA